MDESVDFDAIADGPFGGSLGFLVLGYMIWHGIILGEPW